MRVCFLVPGLSRSGGLNVIVAHAGRLAAAGFHVELVLTEPGTEAGAAGGRVSVCALADAATGPAYDVAVATWWTTAEALWDVPARRRAVYVQSFEERFYRRDEMWERLGAAAVLDLPVDFIVIAEWMRSALGEIHPGARCHLVPNGIDKTVFAPRPRTPHRGPLRVLVEGQPSLWFKGVQEAVGAVRAMREPVELTLVALDPSHAGALAVDRLVGELDPSAMADLYAESDILLKLSRVEGLPLPPLEGLHLGLPCVVAPFTGHEEYVRHGLNGVVVGYDDPEGTAEWLDLLARDRDLLIRLGRGARRTAEEWPGLDASADRLARALEDIAAAPAPCAASAPGALLRTVRAASELGRGRLAVARAEREALAEARALVHELARSRDECAALLDERRRVLDELTASRAYRAALGARRVIDRVRR